MNSPNPSVSVKKSNSNYNLTDADLAALFISSLSPTTPSPTLSQPTSANVIAQNNPESPNQTLDDVFLNQMTDLVCRSSSSSSSIADKQQSIGPPPGFENFLFNPSSPTNLLLSPTRNHNAASDHDAMEIPVSSSDTINFSQLLPSTSVDSQQPKSIVNNAGNIIRSSSSSHSPFISDDQSIFFPISNHPYSSSSMLNATSQILSVNTPSSSTTTPPPTTHSAAKPHIPNSLSLNNNNQFSSPSLTTSSSNNSPVPTTKTTENEKRITNGANTPSHIFSTTNSFFSNGHTDFASLKPTTNKTSQAFTAARTSSSSASSSTSSSIDEALIQLSQQQHQQHLNKLFNDEPTSIFHFPTIPTKPHIDKQQQAVHENISFLASMASASAPVTPESSWQPQTTATSLDPSINTQRKMRAMLLQQQQQQQQLSSSQSSLRNKATDIHELLQNLNELCYKGFDELNAVIQEQRWVQNYANISSSSLPSPNSPASNLHSSNCCSSRILIVPEYFVFKCKKVEASSSHVFELLAAGRPELRLRELMFVFKSWKESISTAELVHQEEENKLRLSTEHLQSYYMTDTVLQSAFDRVSYAIRQLCNITQQARAAFQYATLNVFQTSSRQAQIQSQLSSSANQPSSTSNALAQFQAMQHQQQKTSVIPRPTGIIRTTP